jgi:hypothetical protein
MIFSFCRYAPAGSITNNFEVPRDFVVTGILGDTNWDGVYLGFGDIPGGDPGGSGNGVTLAADASVSFPSFLTVQTTGSDWSGSGDDGFFLWRLVAGDFDVSVQSSPVWQSDANNFAGLLVRPYNTNGSGAPVSFTSTNGSENWLALFRAQQFGINEIRQATNALNFENTFSDAISDTNSTRFFRISRTGDTFTFYWKTNQSDAWVVITNASANGGYVAASGTVTRSDWAGIPLQVGIAQAVFSLNSPQDFFTDFELSGTNVSFPVEPTPPSALTVSTVNTNSVSLSWTVGSGSDGSLVLVRANGPINAQPIQGYSYTGNTNFQSTSTLLSAANNHVVYVGTGNNVTVTGLGGSNNTYHVAVFSYQGSGSARVYNTASPATNITIGPGRVSSVTFTVSPTNVPMGGLAVATVTATYDSGDSYDVSSDPNTIWTSSDPNILLATNGLVTGITNGSATVSATYAGVTGVKVVTVHAPAFTDSFNLSHDYASNGIAGSTWDGLYLGFGYIPNGNNGGDGNGVVTVANSNVTTNNALTVTAKSTTWVGAGDDGFLLFKVVPGDFQVAVHMASLDKINYQFAGLMARAANPDGSAYAGSENWVYWGEFEEFNDSTEARTAINGNDTEFPVFDGAMSDFWLLMTRVNGTNFNFYRRVNPTDPWQLQPVGAVIQPTLSNGVPVQVGLFETMYTAAFGTAQFDSFMLDAGGISGATAPPSPCSGLTMTLNSDNVSMNLTWNAGTNSDGSQATSMVIMRAGAPVSEQPYFGFLSTADARFGFGTDLGSGNYVVFRAVGTNVTVTSLTPGTTYYAAVYSYSGSGTTKVFNQQTAAVGSLAAGTLIGISTSLPGNGIPMGGVGLPIVHAVYNGGGGGNISSLVTFTSDNTNVIVATTGVLTGLTNGTANITASYQGFTNTLPATVRSPTFTDNFGVNHDYLANGVTGTPWDGVYAHPGTIPDTTFVSDPAAAVLAADANISSNHVLTVTSINVGWEFDQNDGFFLFKYVAGDFQIAVHITSFDVVTYNNPGLLARAYRTATNGNPGAPFGGTNGESWVSWSRFDEFGIGTYARLDINNATTRSGQLDPGDTNYWLLIVREGGTNFAFYQRLSATDPWTPAPEGTTYSVPTLSGMPMQVGIEAGGFDSGVAVATELDSFMLDVVAQRPELHIALSGGDVLVSWPTSTNVTLQSTLRLDLPNWLAVTNPPVDSGGTRTVTLPATNVTSFYRLVQ